jgi:hypothetical protein
LTELKKEQGLSEEIIANGKNGEEAENLSCGRFVIRLSISEDEIGLHMIFWQGNLSASDCF